MPEIIEEFMVTCWHCTCEFNAFETSFCNHIDPYLICPFCLKCGCDTPEEYKIQLLKDFPKSLLEEKLILESRTSLKLGEILIRAGKITRNHLLSAIDKQKHFNKRIGQIFIMMDLLTQKELEFYLKEQKGIEHMDLKKFEIDNDLVEMIGRTFCLEKKIIPIEYYHFDKNKILRFIIYSIDDINELKKTKRLEGFTLIPYEAPLEDINRLLKEIKDYDLLVLE